MALVQMVTGGLDGSVDNSGQVSSYKENKIQRTDFPHDFVFGSATSAFQIEGGWNAGSKGMSIWDVFTLKQPGGITDNSSACTAIDHYNQFREDVILMKKMGFTAYRFSIAWTRILPGGKLCTGVCPDGIRFYNDLINALLAVGIEPYVTLFHWDTPHSLEEEYGGFLSRNIIKDFSQFAELCFWEFGDRVKQWITLNEPSSYCVQGYVLGAFPPNRGKVPTTKAEAAKHAALLRRGGANLQVNLTQGDPGVEPYTVAHNLILCHAHAVDIYRKRYQEMQGGKIGMTNNIEWYEPLTDSKQDKDAANRRFDFMLGWFVEPLVHGDYPETMIENVADRLPRFTEDEEKLVKGSYDFLGINYYTANYASNDPETHTDVSLINDMHVTLSTKKNNVPIGPQAGSDWLHIVPWGIKKTMLRMKEIYNDPVIYITENGVDEKNDKTKSCSDALDDQMRIDYHHDHLVNLKQAMDEGVKVKGYFVWSLFDNFEWAVGYSVRFGLIYVDFSNGRYTRLPKYSAVWWRIFLSKKPLPPPKEDTETTEQRRKRLRNG